MTSSTPTVSTPAARLPLFYRNPVALSSATHADWRLEAGDASFAAEASHIPVLISEIVSAARSYPLVFAADDTQPVALLGLEARNLFVEAGRWSAGNYVPAYVRRYPFGIIATVNPEGYALAIDAASDRIASEAQSGTPLFENGEPSDLTRQALEFCKAFQSDIAATRAFADALAGQDLLIDRRADATLADGRTMGLDGFRIVDAEKFAALPDAVVLEWHRKGWLALIHFHLASLDRFTVLLELQAALFASESAAEDTASVPELANS